jgi:hypothetical protein
MNADFPGLERERQFNREVEQDAALRTLSAERNRALSLKSGDQEGLALIFSVP